LAYHRRKLEKNWGQVMGGGDRMRRLLLVAAFSLVMLAAGCRTEQPPDGLPVSPPPGVDEPGEKVIAIQTEPMSVAEQMKGQTGIVEMQVTDRGFEPKILRTTIGGTIKVHLRNTGSQVHNFVLPQFGIVAGNTMPGGDNYIEFTASQKGEWSFYSDTTGQPESGLNGTLKVE
jgi:plastocyanin